MIFMCHSNTFWLSLPVTSSATISSPCYIGIFTFLFNSSSHRYSFTKKFPKCTFRLIKHLMFLWIIHCSKNYLFFFISYIATSIICIARATWGKSIPHLIKSATFFSNFVINSSILSNGSLITWINVDHTSQTVLKSSFWKDLSNTCKSCSAP